MSEAKQYEALEIYHLSPVIGTEVLGIDLSKVDRATAAWLNDLLVERKVLFFRDQEIAEEEHIAFAARFGGLEVHPFTDNNVRHPEIIQLNNDREHPPYINIWHSDVTWREEPSLGSIFEGQGGS